jgi:PAS domain-containing protein
VSEGTSLLSFLDAPVLVGDPQGAAIYVNPAFERRFGVVAAQAVGEDLAALFSGGGREAVLGAVARVCGGGGTQNFRLKEEGRGYLVVASPIQPQADHVGVVLLLTDEPLADERLIAFHREIEEPLAEVLGCFEELVEETGGRRNERFRLAVEKGLSAVGRARKWSDGMSAMLTGRKAALDSPEDFDPATVIRQAAARTAAEFESAQVDLVMMTPSQLPSATASKDRVESVLVRLLQDRLADSPAGGAVTLSARVAPSQAGDMLLLSVIDSATGGELASAELQSALETLGSETLTLTNPVAGRVTAISLPLS